MLIEVCDKCQSQWNLIDVVGEHKVLCHKCFGEHFGKNFLPWTITFDGDLRQFNSFINLLKGT